jgi:outer membrane lipoprotein SlyB
MAVAKIFSVISPFNFRRIDSLIRRRLRMRKLLVVLMSLVLLAATAMPSLAQTRHRRYRHTAYSSQSAARRNVYYSYGTKRTFWQKHRDKLTTAMGAAGGALVGGIAGGRKGAAIGTLAGAGGSALYTYKIRKRHRHY